MIDSHCHLADKQFKNDLDAVIARATEQGIERMIAISDSLDEADECLKIAEKYDQIYCTVGVHPHAAREWKMENEKWIMNFVRRSTKCKAIGEIGLDYHYDNSPRDVQREVFEVQLRLANNLKMPVVIHNRESIDDLLKIVWEVEPVKAVLHCCTEKWEDISGWVDRGYFLSFTGIATYPKSEEIRRTIKECPLEQMMVETDAPYLAPIPHRGKRNEPAFVMEVAKIIAEIKEKPLEEIDRITTANAVEFFGLSA